jgi:hypothetical protein
MICVFKSGWNWPSGSGEEVENVKVQQTDGQQVIRKAHLSFQFRWAKILSFQINSLRSYFWMLHVNVIAPLPSIVRVLQEQYIYISPINVVWVSGLTYNFCSTPYPWALLNVQS